VVGLRGGYNYIWEWEKLSHQIFNQFYQSMSLPESTSGYIVMQPTIANHEKVFEL